MTVGKRMEELFPTAKGTTLKRMIQTGRVRLGGRPVRRMAEVIKAGEELEVLARGVEPPRHRRGDLSVVFEDDDLLVVSKPPGLLTATTPQEKRPTLLSKVTEYLKRNAPKARVGLIHRLDKDARGLLVFSKDERAYFSLKEQLKAREVGREYHAVVLGTPRPASGTIETRLIEQVDGKVVITTDTRKGEPSLTRYETVKVRRRVEGRPELAMLKVTLETGRKHQIRVHMADKGHPILGDTMYGTHPYNQLPMMLAATRLELMHPRTGEMLIFETEMPGDFLAQFE